MWVPRIRKKGQATPFVRPLPPQISEDTAFMLAIALLAVLAVPLLLLCVDLATPRRPDARSAATPAPAPRPPVVEPVAPVRASAPPAPPAPVVTAQVASRAPRIAPGDGMVWRGATPAR